MGESSRSNFLKYLILIILVFVLAVHAVSTFGAFLWHPTSFDDAKWLERAVEDAKHPWTVFAVRPLFGNYYRPVPQLIWLLNYYIWGFNFDGHQLMFLAMWLAAGVMVYALGCRLGGWLCGLIACTLLGFNGVFLRIASWVSWYTTLTELVAVAAWAWCFLKWLETRQRRSLTACIVLGVTAVLCRELAPLVISACVLFTVVLVPRTREAGEVASDGGKATFRRSVGFALLIWAGATLALLVILPGYRAVLKSVIFASGSVSTAGPKDVAISYFWPHFRDHTNSILRVGLSPFLLLFALIVSAGRRWLRRARPGVRPHHVLLGAFVIGAVIVGLPWGFAIWEGSGSGSDSASTYAYAVIGALLYASFLALTLTGDLQDRILGAWFIASFVPIQFLRMPSRAYHILALTALALYVGRSLAAFVRDEVVPVIARLRPRQHVRTEATARFILVAVFAVLCSWQTYMVVRNFRGAAPEINRRVRRGRQVTARIDDAVSKVLADAPSGRRVWIRTGRRENEKDYHALVTGLILREKHGFTVIECKGEPPVEARRIRSPLQIYAEPATDR